MTTFNLNLNYCKGDAIGDLSQQLIGILRDPAVRSYLKHLRNICAGSFPVAFWACVYLMRLVCRKYSYTFLQIILGSHQFEFLKERVGAMKLEIRVDAYLLYGAEYTDIRTTWNEFIWQNAPKADLFVDALRAAIGRVQQPAMRPLLCLLSLNRTLLSDERGLATFEQLLRECNQQVVQTLVASFEGVAQPDVAAAIVRDVLPRGALPTFAQTRRANDDMDRGLREVEAHFQLVVLLLSRTRLSPFLTPLVALALDATRMPNAYLPTMPSDEMFLVFWAIQSAGREKLTYYKCPNGHVFAVGESGSLRATTYCLECNQPIGMGMQYQRIKQPYARLELNFLRVLLFY